MRTGNRVDRVSEEISCLCFVSTKGETLVKVQRGTGHDLIDDPFKKKLTKNAATQPIVERAPKGFVFAWYDCSCVVLILWQGIVDGCSFRRTRRRASMEVQGTYGDTMCSVQPHFCR